MSMKLSTPYCVRFRLSALKNRQSATHPEDAGLPPNPIQTGGFRPLLGHLAEPGFTPEADIE